MRGRVAFDILAGANCRTTVCVDFTGAAMSILSKRRAASVVFAVAATGFFAMAAALFVAAGAPYRTLISAPGAHEVLLVFLLPSIAAAVCAGVLWQTRPGSRVADFSLWSLCVVVLACLVFRGWIVPALMYAAPTLLMLDRDRAA